MQKDNLYVNILVTIKQHMTRYLLNCAEKTSPTAIRSRKGTCNCRDVIMSAMISQITDTLMVCSAFCSGTDQRIIKVPRHWSLRVDFTGYRWIAPQRASDAENVSIWRRNHVTSYMSEFTEGLLQVLYFYKLYFYPPTLMLFHKQI